MMNRKMRILGLVLLLALTGGRPSEVFSSPLETEQEIAAQTAIHDELERKKQEYDDIAKQKSQEAEDLRLRLKALQQITTQTQEQIDFSQSQVKTLQKSAAILDQEIAPLSFQVDELVKTLRARLISMYKYDAREGLHVFFGARNAHEALESAYLISRLALQDQHIIDELLAKKEMLDQTEFNLRTTRAQLTALSETLSAKQAQYEASIAATKRLLPAVQRERKRAEDAVKALARAPQPIDRTLLALLERKKAREAMEREAGAPSSTRTYTTLAQGALLDWPLRGPIAIPYGPRTHAALGTKSFNSGIDIRAASGATVKAAGPGEVLFAGKLRGFGHAAVISHGRDICTVYTHLSSVLVKERDAVRAGTSLGKVGKTGATGGYGFHFEVRVGGAAKDPLPYLKKF
jgi:murein DD-endopeptidase MepM/ murein hydrolase activator NlpD